MPNQRELYTNKRRINDVLWVSGWLKGAARCCLPERALVARFARLDGLPAPRTLEIQSGACGYRPIAVKTDGYFM